MKKIGLIIAIFLFAINANMAQNELEGLRYSQYSIGGTARFISMGGAFGALGGDLGALAINPASAGLFVNNEFSFTPELVFDKTKGKMLIGNETSVNQYNAFSVSNIGYVSSLQAGKTEGLCGISFGITYNKVADFNQEYEISGLNKESSMAYSFIEYANGYIPDDLWSYVERLAYDTYVIDTDIYNDQYITGLDSTISQTQKKTLATTGGMNEIDLNMSANFSNKLYLGASLGITTLTYNSTSKYSEVNNLLDTNFYDVKYFGLEENLIASGLGINLKIGAIFRPVNWIRLGLAYHTRSFVAINEEYSTSMESEVHYIDANGNVEAPGYKYYTASPTDEDGYYLGALISDYYITTPRKLILSLAFVIKQMALLSLDFETTDYSEIYMNALDFNLDNANLAIETNYKRANNLRLGLEIKKSIFSLRGGVIYYDSPYLNDEFFINPRNLTLSGGIGVNKGAFYIDFALVQQKNERTDYFYSVPGDFSKVGTRLTSEKTRGLATFGFRF